MMCLCIGTHIQQCRCGDQRASLVSQFSPSTMCIPGIKIRLPGSATNVFTNWAIAQSPEEPPVGLPYILRNQRELRHNSCYGKQAWWPSKAFREPDSVSLQLVPFFVPAIAALTWALMIQYLDWNILPSLAIYHHTTRRVTGLKCIFKQISLFKLYPITFI